MKPLEKSKILIEKHVIEGKKVDVNKVYVLENFKEPIDLEEWFKKGLGAKKILEYKKDECSFRWIVWYI